MEKTLNKCNCKSCDNTQVMEARSHFKNGLYKLFFLAALCWTTGTPVVAQETININRETSLRRSAHPVAGPEGARRSRYFAACFISISDIP